MKKGIIAIGAHPDDIELGCGASLAKLSEKGFDIFAIVLSYGEIGNPLKKDRVHETCCALKKLGVKQVFNLDFEDTKLTLRLHDIISSLEMILDRISIECEVERIYTMFENDRHQDHRAAYNASIVAFRHIPQILCYETPSSGIYFSPNVFERVDESCLDRKIQSLMLHQSQAHRSYMNEAFIKSIAILRGQQSGYSLSEAFVPYKMML